MPDTSKKFYLTTPIYYVNARPHIGHAYTTIAADVIARRHRLLGDDTFFLTGTDEHGQKVQRSAEAAGIPPQQFADEVSVTFQHLWKHMGITNDDYIRTTDKRHKRGVQLWAHLEDRGAIYLSTYTGQYSIGEEMFVDGPPGTIGPDGNPTETVTEENYYFRLSRFQRPLIELIESGTFAIEPETRRNEVLSFLRGNVAAARRQTDRLQDNIPLEPDELRKIELREIFEKAVIQVQEKGEPFSFDAMESDERYFLHVLAWKYAELMTRSKNSATGRGVVLYKRDPVYIEGRSGGQDIEYSSRGNAYVVGALNDLSISRSSFDWGVTVPSNPKHVVYVWLDALANYMTAIGYGSDDPVDIAKFEKYWPADLHLVGKEITRFHCVYWPAFLLAAELPLPKKIQAHGWLLFEESKMSKSRGNIVRTETILNAFGNLVYASLFPNSTHADQDLFASDVIRYFLLREIPFGQDGTFSFDALITRYNADLANGYGNLVSRTLTMINNFRSGQIPTGDALHEAEVVLVNSLYPQAINAFKWSFENFEFSRSLETVSEMVSAVDSYFSLRAPWKMAKNTDQTSQKNLNDTLYIAAESIRIITALLYPVMPFATASVWQQLGLGSIEEAARNGELKDLQWGGLKPGTKLGPLAPIFPRADKGLAQIMTDMESPTSATPAATPATEAAAPADNPQPATETTPLISIDDFIKVDLRVAQIVVAERIPKADKLLRLEVDLGYERRQILSGIAEWYTPEELIGRRIAIIANLAPRKMRGLESHGMLLAASGEEHASKPILATFSDEIALGSRIK